MSVDGDIAELNEGSQILKFCSIDISLKIYPKLFRLFNYFKQFSQICQQLLKIPLIGPYLKFKLCNV